MNRQKKIHNRSNSIGQLGSNQVVQTLYKRIEEGQTKIKMLQGYVSSLVSKINEKDSLLKTLSNKYEQLYRVHERQEECSKCKVHSNIRSGYNPLGQSTQDTTNIDQNELNIKNRMESMKTFEINKMPTLFQRNMRKNNSLEKIPRVVSHNRIVQLKPGTLKIKQPPVSLIESNTHEYISTQQITQTQNSFNLLQSFMVITGDPSQLNTLQRIDPKIIYSYPAKITSDKQKMIPLFCFPNKINCVKAQKEQKHQEKQEITIFILNSEYTTSNQTNKMISTINPNHYLYGICLTGYSNVMLGTIGYKVPISYVVLTYFPFVKFFSEILSTTLRSNKPSNGCLINQFIIQESFGDLKQLKIGSFPITLRYKCMNKTHTFSIPEPHFVDSLVLSYPIKSLERLNPEIIADVLIYLLLEYSIVLYSRNAAMVSQTIVFLLQIIKPLKYPYPIIVNLPSQMEPMLDSPFPCLLGITNELDSSLSQSHILFNLDTKQIVNRVELPKLHYVFDYLRNSIKSKFSNYNQLMKKLKNIMKEDILSSNRSKHSMMTPFLQIFKNTQIFKYNHQ